MPCLLQNTVDELLLEALSNKPMTTFYNPCKARVNAFYESKSLLNSLQAFLKPCKLLAVVYNSLGGNKLLHIVLGP